MIDPSLPSLPPEDPKFLQAQTERRAELLRSGRATDGLAGGLLELLGGLVSLLRSGLTRLGQWPIAWGRAQRQKRR